jgi:predicted site-specific integrase-resolvase
LTTTDTIVPTYSAAEVCAKVGVSYRQLDYWLRAGLVPGDNAHGSGSARRFTEEDVAYITTFTHMIRAGLRHIRALEVMKLGLIENGRARLTDHIVLVFDEADV